MSHDDNIYIPARHIKSGHLMTLITWARSRTFPKLPIPVIRYFDVANDARVLAHCYWQTSRQERPTLLALHGLEGSSNAHYMRGLADKAYSRGFNVVLLNQRNCGGTEHLSSGLYHSGLSEDPQVVIKELVALDGLKSISVIGYSLGGNVALRLAGDYGTETPPEVSSVCAVSPTMDLAVCVDALERKSNAIYQWNFVRNLKNRMRRKARVMPCSFDLSKLSSIRTVREFDDAFTAPHHGFLDAADYYYRASSLRVIESITIPTLIVTADDDPFIPPAQFRHPSLEANRMIRVIITRGGGHCGFFSGTNTEFDGYWAEQTSVKFSEKHVTMQANDTDNAITRNQGGPKLSD